MTENEIVTLLTVTGSVLVAFFTGGGLYLTHSLKKRTERIRYDITNGHKKPLRNDMDDKHDELMRVVRHEVGNVRNEVIQLRRDLTQTNGRLDHWIEHTSPRNPRRKQS